MKMNAKAQKSGLSKRGFYQFRLGILTAAFAMVTAMIPSAHSGSSDFCEKYLESLNQARVVRSLHFHDFLSPSLFTSTDSQKTSPNPLNRFYQAVQMVSTRDFEDLAKGFSKLKENSGRYELRISGMSFELKTSKEFEARALPYLWFWVEAYDKQTDQSVKRLGAVSVPAYGGARRDLKKIYKRLPKGAATLKRKLAYSFRNGITPRALAQLQRDLWSPLLKAIANNESKIRDEIDDHLTHWQNGRVSWRIQTIDQVAWTQGSAKATGWILELALVDEGRHNDIPQARTIGNLVLYRPKLSTDTYEVEFRAR